MSLTSKPNAALLKEWNKKLKDSGFRDIESYKDDGTEFTFMHREIVDLSRYLEEQDYCRAADLYLHWCSWESPTERRIWELHLEGKSGNQIRDVVRCRDLYVYSTLRKHEASLKQNLSQLTKAV